MKSINYYSNQRTIKFAVKELKRLLNKIGDFPISNYQPTARARKTNNTIFLMLESEYNSSFSDEERLCLKKDGFALIEDQTNTWIIGKEERSVLYGVYHFCEVKYGYRWVELEESIAEHRPLIQTEKKVDIQEPVFSRRGNIIETINDPVYINLLIDWGTKNRLNELFFTFFLWDEMKIYIKENLMKRNIKITLGGHSLRYLVDAAIPGQSVNLDSFLYDIKLQDLVIKKIIAICRESPIITRLSLWPEDVGISEKSYMDFMPAYISFTERLKAHAEKEKLNIDVEHIVYNAGLEWNMLERNNHVASSNIDVLYAYWGRDYSQSITATSAEQKRALESLVDWRKQTDYSNKSITVLEYYSDHFMLSELFPPLLNRINQDVLVYKDLNVDGVMNLIVPVHVKQQYSGITNKYPWKWIHHINNYFIAGIIGGKSYDLLLKQFFFTFGEESEKYWIALIGLEDILAKHTYWNVPLFPARLVDPESVDAFGRKEEIILFLDTLICYIDRQNFEINVDLLNIQSNEDYNSISKKEMLHIYFYYVKEVALSCKRGWENCR